MYTIMTALSLKSLFNWLFNSVSLTEGRWNATKNNEKKKVYWSLQTTSKQNMLGNVYENITRNVYENITLVVDATAAPARWIVFLGHIHNVSGYFWIRNFFFADSASVHTYPANPAYESATFFICSPGWEFLNTLRIRNRMNAKSGYFFIRWHNNLESSSGVNAYTVCKHNVFASLLLGPFFKPSNVP